MYENDYFNLHSTITPIGYYRFECPECDFVCSNEPEFNMHVDVYHMIEKIKNSPKILNNI